MHGFDQIRRWLADRPTSGATEGDGMGSPTATPPPLGGRDSRLTGIRKAIQADVAKNGVQSRSASSPRSNRRSR